MQEEVADLEPQEDASASSDADVRFKDDKSVNTAVDTAAKTVEVETPAKDATEEPESEVDSSPAEVEVLEEKADSEPEVPASVQDRIDKVIESRRKTEELLTAAELENQQLRKRVQDIPVVAEPFKALSDFDFDEGKFQAYMASEMNLRSIAAAERAVSDADIRAWEDRINAEFAVREKAFAKTVKDYDEVAKNRNLPISESMARVVRGREGGPEMIYYLGSQPEVAREIASLSPESAGWEMRGIHDSLVAEKAKAAETKVTKAPPPTPKIEKGSDVLEKDVADMSDREFAKMRRKQIANR